jgi:hypothetical protein
MKSNIGVVSILLGISMVTASAEDKRDKQLAELAAIKAELKPLREKAYLEKDVIDARKKLDAAYRAYWSSVREAMLRLDPSKAPFIEKDMAVRKEMATGGSRAEDYEKKAAAKPTPTPAK